MVMKYVTHWSTYSKLVISVNQSEALKLHKSYLNKDIGFDEYHRRMLELENPVIQFYKNQADRCDLEVKQHNREADEWDTKAADETMTGTSAKAQEYADIANACHVEAALALKEAKNYRNAADNWEKEHA